MLPKIIDRHGKPRTRQWLYDHFGFVYVHPPGAKPDNGACFALVELRETKGNALRVTVLAHDKPLAAAKVMLYWPDAPIHPAAGWLQQGSASTTDKAGIALHILGDGAKYKPPTIGPHSVWIKGQNVSPLITGLGIVNGYHLAPTFRMLGTEERPTSNPVDDALDFLYSADKHMTNAVHDVAAAIASLQCLPNPGPELPPHAGPA
jgi:hypothetical protein